MKRDLLLDNLRALVMIQIVCIIHVLYFFRIGDEYIRSLLLFEMPAIFFIAGASQSLATQPKTIKHTIISKSKRILIPFYVYLAILYIWMAVVTFTHLQLGVDVDITLLSRQEILKTLITGGCDNIPFYGSTWFISIYLIVSLSLPIQQRILNYVDKYLYIALWISIVVIMSFVTFPSANLEIKNLIIYNVFYLIGFCFYKHKLKPMVYIVALITIPITIYGFVSGIMLPMQNHKFPADYLFLFFGLAWLSVLAIIISHIKQKYYRLLNVWNRNGYYLYLYQTITFSVIVCITYKWIDQIEYDSLKFAIYFVLCFCINTLLAYIIQHILSYSSSIKARIINI